jgi:hypothetical protein
VRFAAVRVDEVADEALELSRTEQIEDGIRGGSIKAQRGGSGSLEAEESASSI